MPGRRERSLRQKFEYNQKKYAYVRDKIANAHFSHVMHEIEPISATPRTSAGTRQMRPHFGVLLFRADLLEWPRRVIGQKGGAHQRPTDVDS